MEPKNLEKYVKLCRKYGIEHLKVGEIELKLSQDPPKSPYKTRKDAQPAIQTDPVTDEDLLFWSSGGVPPINEVNNA